MPVLDCLPIGASFWATLAEQELPRGGIPGGVPGGVPGDGATEVDAPA